MSSSVFWSEDERFGVRIENMLLATMYEYCRAADPNETGGILLGRYSPARDCAVIEAITPPPADSRHGPTTFVRGTRGLRRLLAEVHRKSGGFYLGEWHYHPNNAPVYSSLDRDQMVSIASSRSYNCPEPILFIVGGGVSKGWYPAAYVFPRSSKPLILRPSATVSR